MTDTPQGGPTFGSNNKEEVFTTTHPKKGKKNKEQEDGGLPEDSWNRMKGKK